MNALRTNSRKGAGRIYCSLGLDGATLIDAPLVCLTIARAPTETVLAGLVLVVGLSTMTYEDPASVVLVFFVGRVWLLDPDWSTPFFLPCI